MASVRGDAVRSRALGLTVSVAIVGSGLVGASSRAQVGPGCGPDWSLVISPPAKNVNGFAVASPDHVWAVGIRFGAPEQTFTELWDGVTWAEVPSPNIGTGDNALNEVAPVSPSNAWAVGYYSEGNTSERSGWKTLVERWDGSDWTVSPSPNRQGSNSLTSVAAVSSSSAWAVGYHKTDAERQTLIERWNGTDWTLAASPDPGAVSNALTSIAALSSTNVWAVGYRSGGAGYRTLVEHWNGTRWRVVPSANVGSSDNILMGIAAISPTDIWAVGYRNMRSEVRTLIEHWDGSRWDVVPSPNRGSGIDVLLGVATTSASDAWAVGFSFDTAGGGFITLTEHWDGSAWSIVPSPNGDGIGSQLIGTAVDASGRVWAGGRSGPDGLLITTCPSGGVAVTSPPGVESRRAGVAGETRRASGSIATALREPLAGPLSVVAQDVSAEAGIFELTRSRGAVVLDVDDDGHRDIFLGRHQSPARLYRSDGAGHFSEIAVETFGRHDRHGCAAADVDVDGLPDIYCAVGANKGTDIKNNELWIQGAASSFSDQAAAFGVMDAFGRGRDTTVIDVDADGYPDLYLGNEGDRPDGLPAPSRLFMNVGGTSFHDAPEYGLDLETGSGCGQAADFNDDGWEDLLLCTRDGLKLYRNDEGAAFTEVSRRMRIVHNPTDANLVDLDGDGRLDLVEATRKALRVELRRGRIFTPVFRLPLPAGLGLAVGDVNGDEHPDLYVLQGSSGTNAADLMLLNDGDGTSFTEMSIPVTSEGRAESVEPIDYARTG